MLDDLIHPATLKSTPLARVARHLLVGASLVLAVGLTSVVFARGGERRAGIVWVLPGQPKILVAPAMDPRVPGQTAAPALPSADADLDATPQLARPQVPATIEPPAPATRTILMEVTAYCPCTKCCGPQAQGITASGKHVSYNGGKFVAADRKLPFGTTLIIPGYGDGQPVEVIDRGGAIKGDKLDVYFPTHREALEWGRRKILVTLIG